MKLRMLLTAGLIPLAVSMGAAAPAFAFHFLPAGSAFAGTGPVSIQAGGAVITCKANYRIRTNPAGTKARINTVIYSGPAACSTVSAVGLPWMVIPTSLTTAKVVAMALTSSLGPCGPGTMPGGFSASTFTYSGPLAGGCLVSGSINVTPTLAIGP